MNKRKILASLNKIANELDTSGLHKEANTITNIMERIAVSSDGFMDSLNGDMNGEKTFRSLFEEYKDGLNQMLEDGGHSGFSATFIKRHIQNFVGTSEDTKKRMLEEFRSKTQNSDMDSMNAEMDREILKALEFTANFQERNNLSGEELFEIVDRAVRF